ncbi:MAG TPA: tetratricopeptide repeat protein [Gammaproteobacteria bacterium]|nr:tetratricopeptide repeat protein [Gammaproteobacteria bacterium]
MSSIKRLFRRASRGLLAVVLAGVLLPAQADFNDGVLALMMGDNDKALKTFVPLAETSDHAYAQYFLGRMYAEGRGVEVDKEAAAKWFRKAAEKGVQDAQFRLGGCYERGEGVPKDMEYAYGWYSVSAHIGNPKAAAAMKAAEAKLSPEEKESATELSQEMIQKYGTVSENTSRTQ